MENKKSRKKPIKILLIALSDSIHTERWIQQILDKNCHIYLFPAIVNNRMYSVHKEIVLCVPWYLRFRNNVVHKAFFRFYSEISGRINERYYKNRLIRYIKRINPDIIHTLETQNAGYLFESIIGYTNRDSFKWWHTNWGSDIYLFGRLDDHKEKIQRVIEGCDYYSAECKRDIALAKRFGLKGYSFPVYPNTGGFKIDRIEKLRSKTKKPSERKVIALKGYQGWAGRCFVALEALKRVKEMLTNYILIIYAIDGEPVKIAAELFSQDTGMPVTVLEPGFPHEEILKIHGQSRISIGLSISDAISTSVLEAMAMGSFPIQSWTSAADEWFVDGKTGILVPPEDPESVAEALRQAMTSNELVDRAAEENWKTICERLEYEKIQALTISSYEKIISDIEEERTKK